MPGWTTNGVTLVTPATYLGNTAGELVVDTYLPNGENPQTIAVPQGATALGSFNTVTAAGATQGDATLITAFKNIVTVATTVSTRGVRLPVAATGLSILIGSNTPTFAFNVYPATGGKIAAAATNAADSTKLALNKANIYLAVNTTKWIVFRGA